MAWPLEILVVVGGNMLYEQIRSLAPHRTQAAFQNARVVRSLQPAVVSNLETWFDQTVNQGWLVPHLMAYYYVSLHLTLTVGLLLWLYARRPDHYARARTVLFGITFGALAVFWLFPVAPPRLAVPGTIDTLAMTHLDGSSAGGSVYGLVNEYAAFPSLHVAWAAWCAWVLYGVLPTRLRRFAWAYPVATSVVVVGTGNHYLADVLAGVGVLALGIFVVPSLSRRRLAVIPAAAGADDSVAAYSRR